MAGAASDGTTTASDPVRVGLGPAGLPPLREPEDRDRFVRYVQEAERLGYASVCVGDHLDARGAPLLLLAAAAMHTDHITLAAHVLCSELRNPGVLAHEARTLYLLSGGRLELGLGTGWLARDFDEAGVTMAPFAERLARLETTVQRVRAVAGDGPGPTIVAGGGGPAMLAAAARLADIVTVNIPLRSGSGLASNTVANGTRPAVEHRLRIVRQAAAAAGRTVAIHVYVHQVHAGAGWRDQARAEAQRVGLDLDEYVASPHVLAGDVDDLAAQVQARHQALGIGYFSIPGNARDEFAPVLAVLRP